MTTTRNRTAAVIQRRDSLYIVTLVGGPKGGGFWSRPVSRLPVDVADADLGKGVLDAINRWEISNTSPTELVGDYDSIVRELGFKGDGDFHKGTRLVSIVETKTGDLRLHPHRRVRSGHEAIAPTQTIKDVGDSMIVGAAVRRTLARCR
jgi:hypothetical protein